MAGRQRSGTEEKETCPTDRVQAGKRQRHGRQKEDREGRYRDMADRQRTGREETETWQKQTEDRQGRDIYMADRQRTAREET
jgi:hypothetical protein